MFSVGLFSVFSDALKNNNNCVLKQNTTNKQWFIHVHHSLSLFFVLFFLHILHDQFLDYVINSMHNYITCKYRDLSFVVNILQKLQYRCKYMFFKIPSIQSKKQLKAFLYLIQVTLLSFLYHKYMKA